jgi:pimeloyl-ACP methyl ester carboxylesterase
MSDQRTHDVTTTDGVTIVGTVHGQGPPLVFTQGGIGDGDLDWQALVAHLTGRFTCHLPSVRGRGISSDHPDLAFGRLVEDMVAYVDSIGQTTGLVGWSHGGLVLAVAAQSDAVDAVAAVEPTIFSLMDDAEQAAFGEAVAHAAGPCQPGLGPPTRRPRSRTRDGWSRTVRSSRGSSGNTTRSAGAPISMPGSPR